MANFGPRQTDLVFPLFCWRIAWRPPWRRVAAATCTKHRTPPAEHRPDKHDLGCKVAIGRPLARIPMRNDINSTRFRRSIRLPSAAAFTLAFALAPRASAQTTPETAPSASATPPTVAPPPTESAPVPPPSAVPAPSVTPNQTMPTSCTVEELAKLHGDAATFLVEVHARQNTTATTGVVIAPDRILVPNRRVLDARWPITVHFADGKTSGAKVLHHLNGPNLAILKLETPPPGLSPRSLVKTNPALGAPVISVGSSLHGDKATAWDMRFAHVTNLVNTEIAAEPSPGVGAPILTCAGELVGIQIKTAWEESPRSGSFTAPELAKLLANPPKIEPTGTFGFGVLDPKLVVALRPDEVGVGFKFTFVQAAWAPRFFLNANIGAQWLSVPESNAYAKATDVFRWRTQFEGVVGFNHVFDIGSPADGYFNLGLSPYIGAASRTDITHLRRLRSDMTTAGESLMETHVDPLIGFVLKIPIKVDLMYQFQLDLKAPKQSIHTLGGSMHF